MNLDDLKKQWPSEHSPRSRTEIQGLILRKSKSVTAHARRKALIEAGAFALLLLVFFTGLDPEKNHLFVNIFLVLVVLTGILNNLLLYRKMLVNRSGDSLSRALQRQVHGQWQQLQFSVLFSVLLFSAVYTFLLFSLDLQGLRFWIASLIFGLSIALRSWFEVGRWKHSIQQLTRCQMELDAAEQG